MWGGGPSGGAPDGPRRPSRPGREARLAQVAVLASGACRFSRWCREWISRSRASRGVLVPQISSHSPRCRAMRSMSEVRGVRLVSRCVSGIPERRCGA